MQKSVIVTILIVFAASIAYLVGGSEEINSKLEEKSVPNDHLLFQRSFPDVSIDMTEVDKARVAVLNRIKSDFSKQGQETRSLENTEWNLEGPTNIGGRINVVITHPLDEDIILSGCAAGGIFRTEDGGSTWTSINDEMADLAISSIVFDPSNTDIIYAGTGDHNISQTVNAGGGIYKSIDGGESWTNSGLVAQRIVSRIIIDPNNTQIIYAATMGLPFERNDERGLYKSINGGESWEQVLFVSDEAGIIDLVMNPSNPLQLFASSWNRIRNNHESVVSGTDAHIWRTNDGGENWEILDIGLPMENGTSACRIGLAMSQENPGKVFTVIVGTDLNVQGVYKLDNGEDSWTELNSTTIAGSLNGFGWYFGQIRVNPIDDNELTILGVDLWTTYDGSESWEMSTPEWFTYEVHADKHDMKYLSNGEILLATDGGLFKRDLDMNWMDIDEIPNSQIYRVAVNPHQDEYSAGLQDNGTTTGDFNNPSTWIRDLGGDGFQPVFSPSDPDIYYAETQNGSLYKREGFNWSSFNNGIDGNDRRNWDMPLIMSVHDNDVLYTGTYRVYKNTNAYIDNWEAISPMVTGEVIVHNRFHTISTVAESMVNEDILYSGSTDAQVWRTLDGGNNWTEISAGLPERYVKDIKTSPIDANIVYVCHSGYKENDNTPHIHRSNDNGDNWVDISGDLPSLPINHMEIMDDDRIIIATDMGVYYTYNAGNTWSRVGSNMPIIPVFDIAVDNDLGKLIAGTYARSMMSFPLDSLTINDPVGLTNNILNFEIVIFPNPITDIIQLQTNKPLNSINIYTIKGKLIKSENDFSDNNQYVINASDLPPGAYIIVVDYRDGIQQSQQLIKL